MRHLSTLARVLLLALPCVAAAAPSHTPIVIDTVGNPRGYYEYLPSAYNDNPTEKFPVVFFFHGSGQTGNGNTNLDKVLQHGPPRIIEKEDHPLKDIFEENDMIVLSPQFTTWWSRPAIREYIDFAMSYYRIDPSRVYITGLSAGSQGIHDFMNADANADQATAYVVAAVRGNVKTSEGDYLGERTPYWSLVEYHASAEERLKAEASVDNMAGYLKGTSPTDVHASYPGNATSTYTASFDPQTETWSWDSGVPVNADSNLRVTLFPGNDHDSWTATYNNANMWEWLFAQQKPTPSISSPSDGSSAPEGSSVTLQGSAVDADSNAIASADLHWESNIDGYLGSGSSLTTSSLSVGVHEIALYTTDSQYRIGQKAITLSIIKVGAYTFNVDFGYTGDTTSGNWNNITDVDAGDSGSLIANAIDNTGANIGVRLEVDDGFEGTQLGVDNGTVFPNAAQRDAFYVNSTDDYGAILISGLNQSQTYDFKIFASRSTSGVRRALYTIHGQTATLEAALNTSNFTTITGVSPTSQGQILLEVERDNHTGLAYLGAIEVSTSGSTTNQAPVAQAGADQTVELTGATINVSLSGSISDDGLPSSTLTALWEVVSAPSGASVVFSDDEAAQTTATLDTVGSYTLRLTADDSALTASDTIDITVQAGSTQPPSGATVFSQDFDASATLGDYIDASTPDSGQFNALSTDDGAWSVSSSALQLTRSGSTNDGASFQRYTDITTLTFAGMTFDLDVTGTNSYTDIGYFFLGNWTSAIANSSGGYNTSKAFGLTVKARGASDYYLKLEGSSAADIAVGTTISVAWYANITGQSQDYTGPDDNSYSVADGTSDLWIDGVLVLNDVAPNANYGATDISAFRFLSSTSQPVTVTIDNLELIDMLAVQEDDTLYETLESEGLYGANIGSGGAGSSRILDTLDWEIIGSGSGLSGTADSFRFESDSLTGDFAIDVRVKDLTSSGANPLAGIMIRESNASGARMAAVATGSGGYYTVIDRQTTDMTANHVTSTEPYTYPDAWLMLERVGDVINVAVSDDGSAYTQIDTITLSGLSATVNVGLFASSGSPPVDADATFSDFALTVSPAVFSQNFDNSTSVSSYANASAPSTNQFNDISTEQYGGEWTIDNGALRLERESPILDSTAAGAGFMRYTDFDGAPSVLKIEFDLALDNINTYSTLAILKVGDLTSQADYSGYVPSVASTFDVSIKGGGTDAFRFLMNSTQTATYPADETFVHVVWYLNASGSTQSYTGPDMSSYSLDNLSSSLWVGTTQLISNEARNTNFGSTNLTDIIFRCTTTSEAILLFDNITVSDEF